MIHNETPLVFSNQEIYQIHLDLPKVDVLCFRNSKIVDRRIQLNKGLVGRMTRPTMYQSWTESVVDHLTIEWVDSYVVLNERPTKSLLIFDTWGTSSYYHLLIDHILPVWITREWLKDRFGILSGDVDFFRISKNGYDSELGRAQEISVYFLGKEFLEEATGPYHEIVYGYFYNYRPYLGPRYPQLKYPSYQYWLAKFRKQFIMPEESCSNGTILVPLRDTRNFEWVDRFVQKYSHRIKFTAVDFGGLNIAEQVRLAGSASGIFGCEGAAFANMIFMASNSKVVPVAQDPNRLLFHSTLANYIPHQFKSVLVDSFGFASVGNDEMLRFLGEGLL